MAKSAEYRLGEYAYPRGWFVVANAAQVGRKPLNVHYFGQDMVLYRGESGRWQPGVSVFRKTAEGIVRLSDTGFHENDDFCTPWRLFDMLPEGANGWRPKFDYSREVAA